MPMLVLVFTVGANRIYGDYYSAAHIWPGCVGLLFTGLITWALGFWLNRRDQNPENKPTGLKAVYDAPHMFLFLRFEHWGFL